MSKTIRYPGLVAILMESKICAAAIKYLDSGSFKEEDYRKENIFVATMEDKPYIEKGQRGVMLSRTDDFLVMLVSLQGEITPIETGFEWVNTEKKLTSWDDLDKQHKPRSKEELQKYLDSIEGRETDEMSDDAIDRLGKDILGSAETREIGGLPIEPRDNLDFDIEDADPNNPTDAYKIYYQDADRGPAQEEYPGSVGLWVIIDIAKSRHILVAIDEGGNIVGSSEPQIFKNVSDINRYEGLLLKAGYHLTSEEEWPDFVFYNDTPW